MLKTAKKIGIKSQAPPIILNPDNTLFFQPGASLLRNGEYYFNLPPGEYIINDQYRPAPPRNFAAKIKLPKIERNIKRAYEIEYSEVPSKGLIDHEKRKILLDKSLLFQPRHVREFVTLHELAHKQYKTELFCDLKAAKGLLNKGYNPAQVIEGRRLLSGRNHPLTLQLSKILGEWKIYF